MEDKGFLDPLNLIHNTPLHYVFLPEITRKLQFWKEPWALHKLRTVKSSQMSLRTVVNFKTSLEFQKNQICMTWKLKGTLIKTAIKKKVGGTGNCQWSQRGIRLTLE